MKSDKCDYACFNRRKQGIFFIFMHIFRNLLTLKSMNIIQPKYNSPFSDVVSSNAPTFHSLDVSHPIRGFLFGD